MRMTLLGTALAAAMLPAVSAFQPAIESVELGTRLLQPGSRNTLTIHFVNKGTQPAKSDYRVFVHIEDPEQKCKAICSQFDHDHGYLPTSQWQAGQRVSDGPHVFRIPGKLQNGSYAVHIGIFDTASGQRFLDSYDGGTITIDDKAPPFILQAPAPLSDDEARRRELSAAAKYRAAALSVEVDTGTLTIYDAGRRLSLTDKASAVTWDSDPRHSPFGYVTVIDSDGNSHVTSLAQFDQAYAPDKNHVVLSKVLTRTGGSPGNGSFRVHLTPSADRRGFHCRGEFVDIGDDEPGSVHLLQKLFGVTNNQQGASVLPFRTGERFVAATSPQPTSWRFTSYGYGSAMTMFGQEKYGSALILTWDHPHATGQFTAEWTTDPQVPGTVLQYLDLILEPGADSCDIYPVGKGSYVHIASEYRKLASERGLVKTWADKRRDDGNDQVSAMAGCANFKPFVYTHTVPTSRYNRSGKDERSVTWTLDEIAQITEHLNRDLGIDKAMMVLCGWINGGYDNKHPDPLPVAPELGGNDALAKLAPRVKDAGFLFGLHDNYQDMYEDAPSWNPSMVAKQKNGKMLPGGNWAGGPCWLVCADKQVELAARPGNLPEVARLFAPTIYFIDTIFAAPLYNCFDPQHPNTRQQDMAGKIRLSQLARKHFGLFGSEEGREWGVPYADYMEGLMSHRVNVRNPKSSFHSTLGGELIPLFQMVYGDCVNLYTHQSDRATPGRDDYILAFASHAETPLYHFGAHLYFQSKTRETAISLGTVTITPSGPRTFTVNYPWLSETTTTEPLRAFVHFCHPTVTNNSEGIAFQDDHGLPTLTAGKTVNVTRTVTVPEGFTGNIQWCIGVISNNQRQLIRQADPNTRRIVLGSLAVNNDGQVVFDSMRGPEAPKQSTFSRADNGWAEELNLTDRFIKNSYELCSWIARIAADTPMSDHQFLSPDVELTRFGDLSIWINQGKTDIVLKASDYPAIRTASGSDVVLPPNGVLAISPSFLALHAAAFGGTNYDQPVFFTLRALDDKALAQSKKIRVFHGFGNDQLKAYGRNISVKREAVIE